MTGDVLYNDNVKAKFGAGSELEVYSDGTHGIIKESGSGDLLIYGNNLRLGNADGSELYILGNNNAEVQIRHNNATKLATTSTGIDVTGNINLSTANTFLTGAGHNVVQVDSTKTYLYGGTGGVQFRTADNASGLVDITNGGKVGIGLTNASSYYGNQLVVNAPNEAGITMVGATDGESYLMWADGTSGAERYRGYIGYSHASNYMRFATNSSERMRIDSSGNVLVGKTGTAIGTVGTTLGESGFITATRSGDPVLNLNRTSSDGPIADFYRGDVLKGSINIFYSNLMIGKESGARIGFGDTDIYSTNNAGSTVDNAYDLGATNSRFRECHAVNYYGDGSNLTGVGGSTSLNAVGTYAFIKNMNSTYGAGVTVAFNQFFTYAASNGQGIGSPAPSGTWRAMGYADYGQVCLWVRIS
jgi:hypothetical protein